ncbi:MAG: Abi family protein [Thermomicrobiales bacterium]|nr:Abi family protein [Thermomicrobiales bacterium]
MGIEALVGRLTDRGLFIPDVTRASRYIQHIGYYRFKPYMIPFKQDDQFQQGTTFDDILDLYVFDRNLRLLVMDALERIEVAIRAALTDHMASQYQDAHWYLDPHHFNQPSIHQNLLRIVQRTCDERLKGNAETNEEPIIHRSALEHYLITYNTPELPPSWIMVEMLTLGQLYTTYRNLERRADKTAIAKSIGLTSTVLESWLRTYVRVRNICAHHGRFWNVGLGVYPAIPTSGSILWLEGPELPERSRRRIYPVLVSLQSILARVSPHSGWATRLEELVGSRPPMNLRGMGFPDNWTDDEFWGRYLR